MAVLDTAAKYREVLLYNRYQAARDNIERFRKDPPYAYVIPREQRDLPTAATLVQKLMLNGIEVHEAQQPFMLTGATILPDSWVILMDQPFSPLVKELFEAQQYPELRESPNGAPIRPYDVAGWTLPMQMDVKVDAVTEPVSQTQRARLSKIEKFTWPSGSVSGSGPVYSLTHKANASFKAINEVLDSGGRVGFAPSESENPAARERGAMIISGIDHDRLEKIARENSLTLKSMASAPPDLLVSKETARGFVSRLGAGD